MGQNKNQTEHKRMLIQLDNKWLNMHVMINRQ